jgi:mannose-6-phosphate isomerase
LSAVPLYPLRFEPIFQPRIWGGRRLASLFGRLPGSEPIGEAWVLSDRADHQSRVACGPLMGRTIHQVIAKAPQQILGKQGEAKARFPLLLKFLDARDTLSVQVHPSDRHTELLPAGERGKTEAWVVLQAQASSRIYAGLKPGTTADQLRQALRERKLADYLPWFVPKPGDGVFLEAGTVHALGRDLVIFECQQNSDVTYRLYDWDRLDSKTGKPRPLHVDQALACTDFTRGPVGPITPVVEATASVRRERLFACDYFRMWRVTASEKFEVGGAGSCRVIVGIAGRGELQYPGGKTRVSAGDVLLLPAQLGACTCATSAPLTLLEIALPE